MAEDSSTDVLSLIRNSRPISIKDWVISPPSRPLIETERTDIVREFSGFPSWFGQSWIDFDELVRLEEFHTLHWHPGKTTYLRLGDEVAYIGWKGEAGRSEGEGLEMKVEIYHRDRDSETLIFHPLARDPSDIFVSGDEITAAGFLSQLSARDLSLDQLHSRCTPVRVVDRPLKIFNVPLWMAEMNSSEARVKGRGEAEMDLPIWPLPLVSRLNTIESLHGEVTLQSPFFLAATSYRVTHGRGREEKEATVVIGILRNKSFDLFDSNLVAEYLLNGKMEDMRDILDSLRSALSSPVPEPEDRRIELPK